MPVPGSFYANHLARGAGVGVRGGLECWDDASSWQCTAVMYCCPGCSALLWPAILLLAEFLETSPPMCCH